MDAKQSIVAFTGQKTIQKPKVWDEIKHVNMNSLRGTFAFGFVVLKLSSWQEERQGGNRPA